MAISTGSKRGGVTSDINVTPMIDVMLVLLIIFMIVTPLIAAGFRATLPIGKNLTSDKEKAQCDLKAGTMDPECEIILGIDMSGALYLQGTPIADDKLEGALTTIYNARPDDKTMYLKSDNQIKYGRVQQAVEIARTAGVRVIATVTEPVKTGGIFKKQP